MKKAVVIGSSGAIGEAVINELLTKHNIEKIYAFSRKNIKFNNDLVDSAQIDYNDESTIIKAAEIVDNDIDLVFVATGFLHDDETQPEKSIRDFSIANFQKNFLLNTIGPAMIAKYFASKMKRDQKSVFAAISARVGSISDNKLGGWYGYRSSKAALNMLIKNLAIEFSRTSNQRIFIGLHPGTVASKLSSPFTKNYDENKLFSPQFSAKCLLDVIEMVEKKDSGNIYDWDKKIIQY